MEEFYISGFNYYRPETLLVILSVLLTFIKNKYVLTFSSLFENDPYNTEVNFIEG